MASIPAAKPDYMAPMFIRDFLLAGLRGLVLIGMIAAFISSLDSSIHSLSPATVNDIYKEYVNSSGDERHYLRVSRLCILFWGVFLYWICFPRGWDLEYGDRGNKQA